MRVVFVLLAVALAGAAARNAWAADSDTVEAKRHFERGLARFNLGEYKPAIVEFEQAYRLKPDPMLLYNLGQAYRADGDLENAIRMYKAYLRSSDDPPNRAQVETRIAELEARLRARPPLEPKPPVVARPPEEQHPALVDGKPRLELKQPAPARTPVYKKWWLWTGVGVVAAGIAIGLGVGLAGSGNHVYPPVHL